MPIRIAAQHQQEGVVWNGSFFVHHSLALVNRELTLALLDNPEFAARFDLGLQHYEPPTFGPEADARYGALASCMNATPADVRVTVRHHWPPNFTKPEQGKLVVIQPWEFGSLPKPWVADIRQGVDEICVPSNFVRTTYIESGVPGEKVVVVPNGVNTTRFHPGIAPYDFRLNPLTAELKPETFKFLFVGGTIGRKGIDVLLESYEKAFTASDDVVLIIKDFGTDSFYAHQGAGAAIRALQAKAGAARVLYLNSDLSEAEIAGLYAACDCLVHPYRGEGYGLPIAEAMACGKPTIVTGMGAALDFANANNAYLIPATRQRIPQRQISGMETVDFPYWAEPDRTALASLLRQVAENREEAAQKGVAAARDIAALHTWAHAAGIAVERLCTLADQETHVAPTSFSLPMGLSNVSLGGLNSLGDLKTPGLSLNAPGMFTLGNMYEDRKQMALAETRNSDWENAISELEACLVERSEDWDVVNALAVALFRTDQTDRAISLLERGVALASNPRDFQHNLAFVLLQTGQPLAALEHALQALETDPVQGDIRRTVERAAEATLKAARKILRDAPDKQRAQAKRTPAYRELMEAYHSAEEALKQGERLQDTPAAPHPAPPVAASSSKPRLSLCMIVKNEERFLRNCLESAKDVVDEMVIVDTGSTDSTREIAREFGAIVIEHAWKDDFSEARNVSLDHATGTWALWLDADEEIAPESRDKFRSVIENAPPEIGGYMVMFRNWLSSATRTEGAEMAVHHACRLFRRIPGVRFEGRIHEQNVRSLQNLGYGYAHAEGLTLDHFGYAGEIMTLRNKHERFIRMLTREVEECPVEAFRHFHLFNLGNAYFTQGDMENAAHYLGLAAEKPDTTEEFTVTLFVELATSLHRLGRSAEGLAVCERADSLGIAQAGIEFARGYCLLHLERYAEAESAFYAALRYGEEDNGIYARTGDSGLTGFKSWYGLALALVGQDRYFEAQQACEQALSDHPNFVDARYLLSIVLLRQEMPQEARVTLEALLEINPRHEDGVRDLTKLLVQQGDWEAALPYLQREARERPADYDAQALLATAYEHLGSMAEARDIYQRLRMLSPLSPEICVNLGRTLAETGADAEAIDCFVNAIQLDPQYGNAYFNAGDVLYRLGYYDRAAETYIAGLQVEPDRAAGFFVLGNCYIHTADYEAAILSYQQALKQDPGLAEARNNLTLAEELAAKAA